MAAIAGRDVAGYGGVLCFYTVPDDGSPAAGFTEQMRIDEDGGVYMYNLKSGATQGGAGAVADELWITSSHATLPDNVVMIGV
jgi:hypothetical protein